MASKKKNKDELSVDAKKILLGKLTEGPGGYLVIRDDNSIFLTQGYSDGADRVRFFGMKCRNYYYQTRLNYKKAIALAAKSLSPLGRRVILNHDKSAIAYIMKTYVFYPALIVFHKGETDKICLSLYTARCLTAALAIKIAKNRFDRLLPDNFVKIKGEEKSLSEKVKKSISKENINKKTGDIKEKLKIRKKEEEVWDGENWVPKSSLENKDDK